VIEVVVEIPRGSRNKYEFDQQAGVFRLDRVLMCQRFETRHLPRFTRRIDSRQPMRALEVTDLLGAGKTLSDQRDDACIDSVNLLAERLEFRHALHTQLPIMPEAGELGDAE